MLFIDPEMAKTYVVSMGRDRFDRAVGKILLDSDMAVIDMPQELGEVFESRVRAVTAPGDTI